MTILTCVCACVCVCKCLCASPHSNLFPNTASALSAAFYLTTTAVPKRGI
jgi:hypothetical protein